ncbi:hypothetical protein FRC08_008058 [Ceratobasidium sp. 394]|nr:hypothetical protein FRC08_008058 [Ceratobasidium sp. 394]
MRSTPLFTFLLAILCLFAFSLASPALVPDEPGLVAPATASTKPPGADARIQVKSAQAEARAAVIISAVATGTSAIIVGAYAPTVQFAAAPTGKRANEAARLVN